MQLLLWIATVIIEDFANPSGSDHVNDVHLISKAIVQKYSKYYIQYTRVGMCTETPTV